MYFCKLPQVTRLCGIYFLQSMGKFAKKKKAKTTPAKINSLEVVAHVSFSVSSFLILKLSKLFIPENSSDWWRDVSFLLTWQTLFFWSKNQKPVTWFIQWPYHTILGTWNTRRSVPQAPSHTYPCYWKRKILHAQRFHNSFTESVSCETY